MEIHQFIAIIKSRKNIVIQSVIVIFIVAMLFSLLQKPAYKASATILLKEKNVGSSIIFGDLLRQFNAQPERSLQTQLKLLTIGPVLDKVIKKLNLNVSRQELLNKIDIKPEGQANMITIYVEDQSPRKAKEIANSLVAQYLANTRRSTSSDVSQAEKEVYKKLKDTEDNIIILAKEIAQKRKGDIVPDDLTAKMDMATGLYVMLSEKHEQLRISEKLNTGDAYLIAPADIPTAPISPKPVSSGIFSLIGGLFFGVAVAMVVDQLDNTIKSSKDVEKLFDLPVIGQVPLQEFIQKKGEQLVVRMKPKSAAAESYRTIRTNIQYFNIDENLKTIMITSGSPQEGKSLISANIAMAFAQANKKVALISCDLRRPSLHKIFHISNDNGLSNYLAGYSTMDEILHDVGIENITLIPSGPIPPNPSELLGSKKMESLINELENIFDFIIIDTAPVLVVTDCAVLAKFADGVLFVAKVNHTKKEDAKTIYTSLQATGVKQIGVVLNGISYSETYPYRGYGGYVYSEDKGEKTPFFKKARRKVFAIIAIPGLPLLIIYLLKIFSK